MSTSKEYKAVRNCILNELHLTKEDIIKNIEPLLEKLVKQCMLNTYGGNNQIEHWIRCMVADELKQRDYGFVERISKEIIKDHVLNELNIIVSPKMEVAMNFIKEAYPFNEETESFIRKKFDMPIPDESKEQ